MPSNSDLDISVLTLSLRQTPYSRLQAQFFPIWTSWQANNYVWKVIHHLMDILSLQTAAAMQ